MNTHLLRFIAYPALILILAVSAGLLFSELTGWIILSAGLLLQLGFHLKNLQRLDHWSRSPKVDDSLTGGGLWGGVFGRLYRHEKELHSQIARREQEVDMFLSAAQALTDGIILLDRDLRIVFCNAVAETQFNLSARKDRGQLITNLIRQPDFVSYIQAEDFSIPLTLTSERGNGRIYLIFVIPYSTNRQLMQIKDITQSTKLEIMRRDFVANVSHELRTPLTVLSGFLEVLREMPLEPAEKEHYFSMMADQALRMQSIVQDLLTLSSIESAPLPGSTRVDMTVMMDRLIAAARGLSDKRHKIHMDFDERLDLLGSESELTSAFTNLVSNAVRYTPEGGSITISWQRIKEGAIFSVEDTGMGIEAQHIPRLTERFYRVDRGRSRDSGGTGLGLAIVKHALSRHQAQLEVKSIFGKGSTFSAKFPMSRIMQL